MCNKCNDTSILGIRNGDDDTPCECNEINQQPNTVAVEAPLSPEAELRLQLAEVDTAWSNYLSSDEDTRKVDRKRFSAAMDILDNSCDTKFHLLLSLLDAQRQENKRLKEELETANKRIQWLRWIEGAE